MTRSDTTRKDSERRAHPRAKAVFPATIGAAERRFPARVRDLSRTGVCFHAPQALPEMTSVRLDMELPGLNGESLRADGAVVRCVRSGKEWEVAIYFTKIEDTARESIDRFVQGRLAAT